jgi:hypothetical protein
MLIVFGPHFTSSSGAEERLNDAVGALKELLGEGCPWVGAVVRRLAQLHHIKGDAIMAEGLYGGAGGRFAALGEVDIPTTLRAEHVLQLVSGRPAVQIAPSPPQSTKQCMRMRPCYLFQCQLVARCASGGAGRERWPGG